MTTLYLLILLGDEIFIITDRQRHQHFHKKEDNHMIVITTKGIIKDLSLFRGQQDYHNHYDPDMKD